MLPAAIHGLVMTPSLAILVVFLAMSWGFERGQLAFCLTCIRRNPKTTFLGVLLPYTEEIGALQGGRTTLICAKGDRRPVICHASPPNRVPFSFKRCLLLTRDQRHL